MSVLLQNAPTPHGHAAQYAFSGLDVVQSTPYHPPTLRVYVSPPIDTSYFIREHDLSPWHSPCLAPYWSIKTPTPMYHHEHYGDHANIPNLRI
jgi:hypothetical protein